MLIPMAMPLQHSRYLATLARSGNRLSLEALEHKKYVRLPLLRVSHFPVSAFNILSFYLILVDTAFIAQFLPESNAHVFNAGASVWGSAGVLSIQMTDPVRTSSFTVRPPLTSCAKLDCSYRYY